MDVNMFKLGMTTDLEERLKDYKTYHLQPKYVTTTKQCSHIRLREQCAFKKLASFRIDPKHEFFKVPLNDVRDVFDKIERMTFAECLSCMAGDDILGQLGTNQIETLLKMVEGKEEENTQLRKDLIDMQKKLLDIEQENGKLKVMMNDKVAPKAVRDQMEKECTDLKSEVARLKKELTTIKDACKKCDREKKDACDKLERREARWKEEIKDWESRREGWKKENKEITDKYERLKKEYEKTEQKVKTSFVIKSDESMPNYLACEGELDWILQLVFNKHKLEVRVVTKPNNERHVTVKGSVTTRWSDEECKSRIRNALATFAKRFKNSSVSEDA